MSKRSAVDVARALGGRASVGGKRARAELRRLDVVGRTLGGLVRLGGATGTAFARVAAQLDRAGVVEQAAVVSDVQPMVRGGGADLRGGLATSTRVARVGAVETRRLVTVSGGARAVVHEVGTSNNDAEAPAFVPSALVARQVASTTDVPAVVPIAGPAIALPAFGSGAALAATRAAAAAPPVDARAKPSARPVQAARLAAIGATALPPMSLARTPRALARLGSDGVLPSAVSADPGMYPAGIAGERGTFGRTSFAALADRGRDAADVTAAFDRPAAPVVGRDMQPGLQQQFMMPAAQPDSRGPVQGDVYLDGVQMGRWLSDHLAREVGRPQGGATGFDTRLGPLWPGASVGV